MNTYIDQFLQPIGRMPQKAKKVFAVLFVLFISIFLLIMGHVHNWMFFGLSFLSMLVSIFFFALMLMGIFQACKKGKSKNDSLNPFFVTGIWMVLTILIGLFAFDDYSYPFEVWQGLILAGFTLFAFYTWVKWIIYLVMKLMGLSSKPAKPKVPAVQKPAAKTRAVSIHPVYQQYLDQLAAHMRDLQERETSVSLFLDSFFAGSAVSKSRYTQVIRNAKHVLEANYENALRAAGMFGNGEPTRERQEIMARYVADSADVMNKIEKVIDQLISVEQNDQLADGSVLDGLLDDLAATTSYYQRSATIQQ